MLVICTKFDFFFLLRKIDPICSGDDLFRCARVFHGKYTYVLLGLLGFVSNLFKSSLCLPRIKRNGEHFPKSLINNFVDIPLSQLPHHCLKGANASIKISKEECKIDIRGWKIYLHGRLVLSKGDKTLHLNFVRYKFFNNDEDNL